MRGKDSEEKRGGLPGFRKGKRKVAPVIEAAYLIAKGNDRNAFRVLLTNKDVTPQKYSVNLHWQVPTSPKPNIRAPKQ
jgi:hypothetical protein